MLLAEGESSRIRWRLADFYEAAIDATTAETSRLAQTFSPGGQPSWSRSPTTCPTPAPRGSTGSSNR